MRSTAVLVVLAAASCACAQTGTIDQSSPHSGAGSSGAQFNAGATFLIWQQQIRPSVTGQLEGIRISYTAQGAFSFRVALRDGAANSTNPVLFEATITHSANANVIEETFLDMTSINYMQTAGSPFVMEVSGFGNGNTDTPWIMGNYIAPGTGDPLYPEPLFLNGTEFVPGWKLGFDTFVLGGCAADFNHDSIVDFFDYLDFVQAFSANDDSADFNNDDVIDFFDYLDFVQAFAEGC